MTSQWSSSDAWVAGAIAWASARDKVELSRVIGAVGGLNKVSLAGLSSSRLSGAYAAPGC